MEKKYRLIKTYPGSPIMGTEIKWKEYIGYIRIGSTQNTTKHFTKLIVENNPEYWQLIEEKEKTPIFTTEDRVDIFDRKDIVVGLYKDGLEEVTDNGNTIGIWLNGWYTTRWLLCPSENDQKVRKLIKEHFIIFSTKEKAKEYIIMNKSCLSIKDIMNNYNPHKFNLLTNLQDLVKSKL